MSEHDDERQAADVEAPAADEAPELGAVGDAPEPAAPSSGAEAAPDSPGIAYNDRVLVLGYTGSGKSALLDHLFGAFNVQRLLADTKGHEFDVVGPDGELVEPVRDVEAIDWSQPIIHYIDRTGEVAEYQELFAACNRRGRLVVRVDELADLCEHNANRAPTAVRQFITKQRAHGGGLLGASQRPVILPAAARTEAQHVFLFGPALDGKDHRAMAEAVGLSPDELRVAIDRLPPFGFYWWRRATRELVECPPLPEHIRKSSITRRRTLA